MITRAGEKGGGIGRDWSHIQSWMNTYFRALISFKNLTDELYETPIFHGVYFTTFPWFTRVFNLVQSTNNFTEQSRYAQALT